MKGKVKMDKDIKNMFKKIKSNKYEGLNGTGTFELRFETRGGITYHFIFNKDEFLFNLDFMRMAHEKYPDRDIIMNLEEDISGAGTVDILVGKSPSRNW